MYIFCYATRYLFSLSTKATQSPSLSTLASSVLYLIMFFHSTFYLSLFVLHWGLVLITKGWVHCFLMFELSIFYFFTLYTDNWPQENMLTLFFIFNNYLYYLGCEAMYINSIDFASVIRFQNLSQCFTSINIWSGYWLNNMTYINLCCCYQWNIIFMTKMCGAELLPFSFFTIVLACRMWTWYGPW